MSLPDPSQDSFQELLDDANIKRLAAEYSLALKDPTLRYGGWCRNLAAFLESVQKASLQERASAEFQKRLWNEEIVCKTGRGRVKVDNALADAGFREWLAKRSLEPLPEGDTAATEHLQALYVELNTRLRPLVEAMPTLKTHRLLANLFPHHFTTISDTHRLGVLHRQMLATKADSIEGHQQILRRLEAVLGPAPAGLSRWVERMTFPWFLVEKTAEADDEPPEPMKLVPLTAARRRASVTGRTASPEEGGDPLPVMWRLPLRSGREEPPVPRAEQVAHCVNSGVSALGWGVEGGELEEVLEQIEDTYGRPGRKTVERFANAPVGSLVWTLATDGTYMLGELIGPWRYDSSAEAVRLDCYQVRDTRWVGQRILSSEVPGAVIRNFSRPGSSFSQIHDEVARRHTRRLYCRLTGQGEPGPAPSAEEVLSSLLSPLDVEDLVYVYLQVARGYLVLPASRRIDTAAYEYVLLHRDTGRQAIVQVKSGESAVDLNNLEAASGTAHKAYAFSTSGSYDGHSSRVEVLGREQLLEFMSTHQDCLPPRVRGWLAS